MDEKIELLSVSLLDSERKRITELKNLAHRLKLEFGWHYLLDISNRVIFYACIFFIFGNQLFQSAILLVIIKTIIPIQNQSLFPIFLLPSRILPRIGNSPGSPAPSLCWVSGLPLRGSAPDFTGTSFTYLV